MTRISERMLDRARLGELNEDEYRDLVARLEEAGELQRLETLIEEDDTFLERFPPSVMAAQTRERLRRADRAAARGEQMDTLAPRKTAPIFYLAGLAAAALIGFGLYTTLPEGGLDPKMVDDGPAAAKRDTVQKDKALPYEVVDLRKERKVKDKEQHVLCRVGDTKVLPIEPTERISSTDADVMTVTMSERGSLMTIRCDAPGTSKIEIPRRFFEPDYRPADFKEFIYVTVANPLSEDEKLMVEASTTALDACRQEAELQDWMNTVKVEFMVDTDGTFKRISTSGSTAPTYLQTCVSGIVGAWTLAPTDDPFMRMGTLTWEHAPQREEGDDGGVELARKRIFQGDASGAIEACESILRASPDNAACLRIVGVAYKKLRNIEASCEYLNRAGVKASHCTEMPE